MSDIDALTNDLLDIHRLCGLEVTYRTEAGNVRPYWPNRYLQAVRRAIQAGPDAVVAFAARFVEGTRPGRGFGHLQAAGRLDLTVEALVADPRKPYHHLFSESAVAAAASRLADAGCPAIGARGGRPQSGAGRVVARSAARGPAPGVTPVDCRP